MRVPERPAWRDRGRSRDYDEHVDRLLAADIQEIRSTPPAIKLAQALEMMRTGIRLKRVSLAQQNPKSTAEEIERMLDEWLLEDG